MSCYTPEILFKEHYVTIQYYEQLKLVEVEWHGTILSNRFRETLELVLDFIKDKKMENLLVNRKDMARISLADANWRSENWFPRLLKSGIRNSVSVISDDNYNEATISEMIEQKDQRMIFERNSFYTFHEAKNWLLQKIKIEA